MGISEKADDDCDKKCGYRGRVLYEEPARRLRTIAEDMKETPYLPDNFKGSGNDEWEGVGSEDGWRR